MGKTKTKNQNKKNKIVIFSNAPGNSTEIFNEYKYIVDALQSSFENKSNKTIGLIGDFGSGKSTAIEAFIEANKKTCISKKRKIVKVSLADFCCNKDVKDSDLQYSIVQQLFTGVRRRKIPKSPFVKKGFTISGLLLKVFSIIFVFSLVLSILIHKNVICLCRWNNIVDIITGFSGGLSLIFLFLVIPFKNIKAKLDKLEIEMEKISNDNIFDYILDELIYFFYKTRVNLVIFEDIDRCPNCEKLFTKLYTLNVSLNNSPCLKTRWRQPIVFLHAVRETIFPDGEEKSKYFDVLLPVKPVLSVSNSSDVFKEKLNVLGLTEDYFDKDFVSILSTQVSYFRQMNNLLNSFNLIYKTYDNSLTKNDRTYLLAGLLYKSMFPQDFIYSLKGKGVLRYLFVHFDTKSFSNYIKDEEYCVPEHYKIEKAGAISAEEPIEEINRKHKQNAFYKKAENNYDQIEAFYKNTKDWLNEESIMLISSLHESELSMRSSTYIVNVINDRKNSFIEEEFSDPNSIIKHKEFINHIGKDAACNIQLLFTMMDCIDNPNIYKKFISEFNTKTTIKNLFIITLFNRLDTSNESKICKFFNDISENYDILNDEIIGKIEDKEKYYSLICSSVAKTEKTFNAINKGNVLSEYLKSAPNIDQIRLLSDEVFNQCFIEKGIKFDYINYDEKYEDVLFEKFHTIISKNLFVISNENIGFIYNKLNINSAKSNFLSSFESIPQTLSYILDAYKDGSRDITKICNNFSNENPLFLSSLLMKSSIDFSKIPNFFETCPALIVPSGSAISSNYLNSLMDNKKLSGTFDDLGSLRASFPNMSWITLISKNPELLINGVPETENGNKFLLDTLKHTTLPTEKLINKILTSCIDGLKIDFKDFPNNCLSYQIALSNGLVPIDNNTLSKVGDDDKLINALLSSNNIKNIISNINSLALNEKQLLSLVNTINNDNDDLINVINSKQKQILASLNSFKSAIEKCDVAKLSNDVLVGYLNTISFEESNIGKISKIFPIITSDQRSNYLISQFNLNKVIEFSFKENSTGNKLWNLNYKGIKKIKCPKKKVYKFKLKV